MGPLGRPQEGLFGTVTVGLGTQDLTLFGVKIWTFGRKKAYGGLGRYGHLPGSGKARMESKAVTGSEGANGDLA